MGNSCSHLLFRPQLLSHRFIGQLAFFIFRKVKPCKSFRNQRPMSAALFPVRSSLAWGNSTDEIKNLHRLVTATQCRFCGDFSPIFLIAPTVTRLRRKLTLLFGIYHNFYSVKFRFLFSRIFITCARFFFCISVSSLTSKSPRNVTSTVVPLTKILKISIPSSMYLFRIPINSFIAARRTHNPFNLGLRRITDGGIVVTTRSSICMAN